AIFLKFIMNGPESVFRGAGKTLSHARIGLLAIELRLCSPAQQSTHDDTENNAAHAYHHFVPPYDLILRKSARSPFQYRSKLRDAINIVKTVDKRCVEAGARIGRGPKNPTSAA